MSLEPLCYNLTTGQWILSVRSPQPVPSPFWAHGDARDFSVTFVRQTSKFEVEVVADAIAAQVALSDPAVPATVLTSDTADPSVDNAHPFVLAIAGASVDAFMVGVTATNPKATNLQFRIVTPQGESKFNTTIYLMPKTATGAVADAVPEDPALRKSEATGMFVTKELARGTVLRWPDEVDGRIFLIRLRNAQLLITPA